MRITLALLLIASPAQALAPCPISCHLAQGTPVVLTELHTILITRCDHTTKRGKLVDLTCVTERLDLAGKLIEKLPHPNTVGGDPEFEHEYIDGHTAIELDWQSPWTSLAKPYLVADHKLELSLAKSKLTCKTPNQSVVRDFSCTPHEVHVFAASGSDKAIAIAVCQPTTATTHEVVVVCDGA